MADKSKEIIMRLQESRKLVANPWQPWNNPMQSSQPTLWAVDFAHNHDDAVMAWGMSCWGICQPFRPQVLRKTVNSRIVEPLALPEPAEQIE